MHEREFSVLRGVAKPTAVAQIECPVLRNRGRFNYAYMVLGDLLRLGNHQRFAAPVRLQQESTQPAVCERRACTIDGWSSPRKLPNRIFGYRLVERQQNRKANDHCSIDVHLTPVGNDDPLPARSARSTATRN